MSGKQKMFLTPGKNIFCFRAAKFVSATHVPRSAKLGNICIRNNVSATMFPSLARPLRSLTLNFSRMLGDFIAGSLRELNYNEMF